MKEGMLRSKSKLVMEYHVLGQTDKEGGLRDIYRAEMSLRTRMRGQGSDGEKED